MDYVLAAISDEGNLADANTSIVRRRSEKQIRQTRQPFGHRSGARGLLSKRIAVTLIIGGCQPADMAGHFGIWLDIIGSWGYWKKRWWHSLCCWSRKKYTRDRYQTKNMQTKRYTTPLGTTACSSYRLGYGPSDSSSSLSFHFGWA